MVSFAYATFCHSVTGTTENFRQLCYFVVATRIASYARREGMHHGYHLPGMNQSHRPWSDTTIAVCSLVIIVLNSNVGGIIVTEPFPSLQTMEETSGNTLYVSLNECSQQTGWEKSQHSS